jgi:sugar phosphate isomerase/epimerase
MHEEPEAMTPVGRRDFLKAASLSALALPEFTRSAFLSASAPQALGLQLYTVRDWMRRDMEYTLKTVYAVGYREVEFAGLFDKKPDKVKVWLDKIGLKSPSSHISYERLKANLPAVADEVQTLGNSYVVCPDVDARLRLDADAWKRVAADFNRIGEQLQRVGLRFAYHNHEFEWTPLPTGEIGYDILVNETDPKYVKLQMDLFWITKAGKDPLTYFAKFPGRFPMVHVKDMTGKGRMVNVGQGSIDWARIFAKRREAGIEYLYVEHDDPTSPFDDIKVSYDYLVRLGL